MHSCEVVENRSEFRSASEKKHNAPVSTVFEHLDRSKRPHRSNRRRKIDFDSLGKSTQTRRKLFGPRKSRCVDCKGKYNANAKEFSTVFEHLDRSRRPHRSNRRQKNRFEMFRKINANPKKIVRAPKTKMRRFH